MPTAFRLRSRALMLGAAVVCSLLSVPQSSPAQASVTALTEPAATAPGAGGAAPRAARTRVYPTHTGIIATTFWVGEIFDPDAPDGSQMYSTYDDHWYRNYGGCDGARVRSACRTERRHARHGYFPRRMTPKQNPFYLDLPYDDLNDRIGFRDRGKNLPWAHSKRNKPYIKDRRVSLMKDRWVRISRKGRVCYGQIQDAGPGKYHDARYVFGHGNARPASKRYNNAGMDVSPALNSCLRFSDLNGQSDKVRWRFVEARDVPRGPWKRIVTRTKRPAPR